MQGRDGGGVSAGPPAAAAWRPAHTSTPRAPPPPHPAHALLKQRVRDVRQRRVLARRDRVVAKVRVRVAIVHVRRARLLRCSGRGVEGPRGRRGRRCALRPARQPPGAPEIQRVRNGGPFAAVQRRDRRQRVEGRHRAAAAHRRGSRVNASRGRVDALGATGGSGPVSYRVRARAARRAKTRGAVVQASRQRRKRALVSVLAAAGSPTRCVREGSN